MEEFKKLGAEKTIEKEKVFDTNLPSPAKNERAVGKTQLIEVINRNKDINKFDLTKLREKSEIEEKQNFQSVKEETIPMKEFIQIDAAKKG